MEEGAAEVAGAAGLGAELLVEVAPGDQEGLLEAEEAVAEPGVEVEGEDGGQGAAGAAVEGDGGGQELGVEVAGELDCAAAPAGTRLPPEDAAAGDAEAGLAGGAGGGAQPRRCAPRRESRM